MKIKQSLSSIPTSTFSANPTIPLPSPIATLRNERRGTVVVITGLGPVTPVGNGKTDFWDALCAGKSGVTEITRFDTSSFPTRIAAEVNLDDLDFTEMCPRKLLKMTNQFSKLVLAASFLAIKDANLDLHSIYSDRIGVCVGTGSGGQEFFEAECLSFYHTQTPKPRVIPVAALNSAAGLVSIIYRLKGPNLTISTACSSGANAIGYAFEKIQTGRCDVMIAIGAEAMLTQAILAGFSSLMVLSERNDLPESASRPFDQGRDGFVIGEGAGAVVLESLDHARERNATIYAELVGYANTCEAHHVVAPDTSGIEAARTIELALHDAGVLPHEIDYINAHGTSTAINDKVETTAIKKVFGEHAYSLSVSAIKSTLGHTLGASGAIEVIATALAVKENLIPPTINYETPDPDCDLDYTPNSARKKVVNIALSNSFGFGGNNVCLVLRKFTYDRRYKDRGNDIIFH